MGRCRQKFPLRNLGDRESGSMTGETLVCVFCDDGKSDGWFDGLDRGETGWRY